jgi:DNA-binding MarR family transcriptional regulator
MTNKKMIKLQNLLEALIEIDPEFPIQWVTVFAEIASEEGISLKDISDRTGISMSVMSRTIGALSNARRMGKPYGLVTVKSAKDDRRRKELFLSVRGKKLLERLEKSL